MYAIFTKALATGLVVFSMSATALADDTTTGPEMVKLPQMWQVVNGKWSVVQQKPKAKHQVFRQRTGPVMTDSLIRVKLEKMPFITVELPASED
jgi:hypothetical protein